MFPKHFRETSSYKCPLQAFIRKDTALYPINCVFPHPRKMSGFFIPFQPQLSSGQLENSTLHYRAQSTNSRLLHTDVGQYSTYSMYSVSEVLLNPSTISHCLSRECATTQTSLTLDRLQSGKAGAEFHLANCKMTYSSPDTVESF